MGRSAWQLSPPHRQPRSQWRRGNAVVSQAHYREGSIPSWDSGTLDGGPVFAPPEPPQDREGEFHVHS